MTKYAEGLIEYCMWYGRKSREDAIKFLDSNASPLWKISSEQPSAHEAVIIQDSGDE